MLELPKYLPRPVSPLPDEYPASYVARLAWANGFENFAEFASILGLEKDLRHNLSKEANDLLTEKTNCCLEPLKRFSITSGVIIPFGDGLVRRAQVKGVGLRYCSQCLEEDNPSGRYIRGQWQWRVITHCPRHGCRLDLDLRDPRRLTTFNGLACSLSGQLDAGHECDRYFYGRLSQPADASFLDSLPAYVAAEFCVLLGKCLQMQEKRLLTACDEEETELRRGFRIASGGRNAIWSFLSQHVEKVSRRIPHPSLIYSPFLRWWAANKHNPDAIPVMQLIQSHAVDHVAVGPGENIAWPVAERVVHSVKSASREYRLPASKVRMILAPNYPNGVLPHFFKKAEIEALLVKSPGPDKAAELVDLKTARRRLGVSVATMKELVDTGLISRQETANTRSWRSRKRSWVKTTDLEQFLFDNVSVDQLAASFQMTRSAILESLTKRGVRPILPSRFRSTPFVRRADMDALSGLSVRIPRLSTALFGAARSAPT